ncbi:MAG: molybdopterin-dependent oxidoreductase [Thermoleophilaceae bacterium]|nr:molybdopterin-dependent oxidoreductase [Thermoleophilaceae bacterium]
MVAQPREWNWMQFHQLPQETVPCDIHCVTKWSKLGTSFEGVSVDTLLEGAEPQAAYTMAHSYGGLTVDRLADGEVSPYLHDVVEEGDQVEVRGPFASYFVWRGEAPVLLVGGGSGVVPLMAIMRHRRRTMPDRPMRLVYSVRTAADVIYEGELGDDARVTFTREPPAGWSGHTGRIDASLVAEPDFAAGTAFVCGSNGFVESASRLLLENGFQPERVRTERFGPTG